MMFQCDGSCPWNMLTLATRTEEKQHGVGFAAYEIKPSRQTAHILILRKRKMSLPSAICYSGARRHAPALRPGSARFSLDRPPLGECRDGNRIRASCHTDVGHAWELADVPYCPEAMTASPTAMGSTTLWASLWPVQSDSKGDSLSSRDGAGLPQDAAKDGKYRAI